MTSKKLFSAVCAIILVFLCTSPLAGQESGGSFPQGSSEGRTEMGRTIRPDMMPNVDINITQPKTGKQMAFSVQLLVLLTVLTLAPSILILTTCFLRFSVALDFIKRALSLQQVPPTSVLNGIAFFMTMFVMWPTFKQVYDGAFRPLQREEITIEDAYKAAEAPMRAWMFTQMSRGKDGEDNKYRYITVFMQMTKTRRPARPADVPTRVLIPAYILHELTSAFKIGVILYIPFIIIDMVVASILMSMGMMMLPPVQISMPFKLMLFVLVDGWGLLTEQLFKSVM